MKKSEQLANDKRIVLTLDAGGTNLVFSAIRGNEEIIAPIVLQAHSDDLDRCLGNVVKGFTEAKKQLASEPAAISFAFPGPADYENGIIGDLPNFTAFTGGVPLGPMLEDHFGIPVFINNDGNLFTYGEALSGFMPWLNTQLKQAGSIKQYTNLVGFTVGTGFGSGIVMGDTMILGHSTSGAEIHNTLNAFDPNRNAEESVSTRAIQRVYAEEAGLPFNGSLMPREVYEIARGEKEGVKEAALQSFISLGRSLGNSIANTLSLFDGIVVLGGGLTAAWDLFASVMFEEINRNYEDFRGIPFPRLSYQVYNLEDQSQLREFAGGEGKELIVPGSNRKVIYDGFPRTGVGLSKLGANKSTALGAYAFALQKLDAGHP